MFDAIDPRSPVPIYAQIATQVRLAVAAGEMRGGDPLPSVRALAADLRVNPATVVQAYRELAAEGVVEMKQGAGSFIAALETGQRQRVRRAEARRLAREFIEAASRAGISVSELRTAIDEETGGRKP
ncbi:MAG: GntR family transcriptional regulator [Gemmatimonadetes bacterium]|nr:GntR family transcriptional regulator [Gemmatimonadota bacterium]